MISHEASATASIDPSLKGVISNPNNLHNINALVKSPGLADLPLHIIQEFVFPNLSDDESDQFISSQYGDLKAILKLWNPRKRLKLLQRALRRTDPAFDNNYLLRYSAAKGLKDVVELLLKYQSVDPKARGNWALILAAENNHADVYDLLCKNIGTQSGLKDHGSSYSLLMDMVNTVPDEPWKYGQQRRDLQLLLDTSTKILPYLKDGIVMAIENKRTDLAKIMLYFVAFDHSFFNQMVLIRQLAAGNSLTDIRRIDPFSVSEKSLFLHAVEHQNVELANFMLDEGIHWIQFPFLNIYSRKLTFLEASDIISQQIGNPVELTNQLHELGMRIQYILQTQVFYRVYFILFATNYLLYRFLIALRTLFLI